MQTLRQQTQIGSVCLLFAVQVYRLEWLGQEYSGMHARACPVRARAPHSTAGRGQHPPRPQQEPGILSRGQVSWELYGHTSPARCARQHITSLACITSER